MWKLVNKREENGKMWMIKADASQALVWDHSGEVRRFSNPTVAARRYLKRLLQGR